jgi:hypothetical protein
MKEVQSEDGGRAISLVYYLSDLKVGVYRRWPTASDQVVAC